MTRRLCVLFGQIALALAIGLVSAAGDEPSRDFGSGVNVEAVSATAAPVGGTSELRFRILNEGTQKLVFLGVTTPVAERANLVARTGSSRTSVLQSFSISPDDVFDLTTSHLRYELFPLKRRLAAGNEFPVTLNFVGFNIEVSAHVH